MNQEEADQDVVDEVSEEGLMEDHFTALAGGVEPPLVKSGYGRETMHKSCEMSTKPGEPVEHFPGTKPLYFPLPPLMVLPQRTPVLLRYVSTHRCMVQHSYDAEHAQLF